MLKKLKLTFSDLPPTIGLDTILQFPHIRKALISYLVDIIMSLRITTLIKFRQSGERKLVSKLVFFFLCYFLYYKNDHICLAKCYVLVPWYSMPSRTAVVLFISLLFLFWFLSSCIPNSIHYCVIECIFM